MGMQQRLREIMNQPAVKRTLPAIIFFCALVAGVLLYRLLQVPAYESVYHGLDDAEKSSIFNLLENSNFDTHISTSGQIEVKKTDFFRAKMLLAENGLPKRAISGYSLLEDLPVGISRNVEQVKLRQTLETELSQSIISINSISAARVHLALPEKSAFVRERQEASASVVVKVESGRSLSQEQVRSIIHLVSSSTIFLPSENVTIVDQYGHLLSSPETDEQFAMSEKQLDYQVRLEKIYQKRIINLLTPVVGIGNIIAEVNLALDFTHVEKTQEIFEKPGQVRSEQNSYNQRGDTLSGGVPGTLSNQPPVQSAVSEDAPEGKEESGNKKSSSSSSVKNYEVGRELVLRKEAVGIIKKMTIATIIRKPPIVYNIPTTENLSQEAIEEAKQFAEEKAIENNKDLLEQAINLIRGAVGYEEMRGDMLTVSMRSFVENPTFVAKKWYDLPWIESVVRVVGSTIIMLCIIFGIFRPFVPKLRQQYLSSSEQVQMIGAGGEDQDNEEEQRKTEKETMEDLRAKFQVQKTDESLESLEKGNTYDEKVMYLRVFVHQNIGRATNVFKSWSSSDDQ
jgi:flagellar M-ring protein FliF